MYTVWIKPQQISKKMAQKQETPNQTNSKTETITTKNEKDPIKLGQK